MTKKLKLKKVPKTIYFEPDLLEQLEACMSISKRSITSEVNYSIQTLFEIRHKQNEQAIAMADEHSQRQN